MIDPRTGARLLGGYGGIALVLIAFFVPSATWAQEEPGRFVSTREAILQWIECSNPEEVARLVFGEDTEIEAIELGIYHFSVGELGDGTRVHIFEPPGGSGSWAPQPSLHFTRGEGERLELIFESSHYAEYLTELPRFNGRYQLIESWRADFVGGIDDEDVLLAGRFRLWFWNGEAYVEAYTRTEIEESTDPSKIGVTMAWKNEAAYRAARRTWTYRVVYFDTLSRICLDHEVPCDEVARQSGISDPDQIWARQVLVYDSAK